MALARVVRVLQAPTAAERAAKVDEADGADHPLLDRGLDRLDRLQPIPDDRELDIPLPSRCIGSQFIQIPTGATRP